MICASPVQRVENERLRDENKVLKAENAKLRRLCGTFWAALKGDPEDRWFEDECPLVLCEHMFDCEDECVFEREMHELGIEVADD